MSRSPAMDAKIGEQSSVIWMEEEPKTIITSRSHVEFSESDKKIDRRLKWKIDFWILPTLTLIYLLAAMDRSDIGNAQVAGMQKALKATDSQWSKVVSLFYVGFIIGHPPGVYSLRKVGPPLLLGLAVAGWGVLITLFIETKTWAQAAGLRICIGFAEGITHAGPLYLSLWYLPSELATRGGVFYSAASLAGAFNGLIAYGITRSHSNTPPFQPWQWLFLVEGIISIGIGLITMIVLPQAPDSLRWGFSEDEKRLARIRTQRANNTLNEKIRWRSVPDALKFPMWIVYTVILSCAQVAIGSLSSFLPSIIKAMGYSSVNAQLLTVPVYSAACFCTIFFPILSDRTKVRGPWIAGLAILSLTGYIMLLASHRNSVRYAGTCLAAMGQYPITVIVLTWVAVNTPNFTHRATISAVTNIIAQGISVGVLMAFDDPPYYHKGVGIVIGLVCCIPIAALSGIFYVRYFNSKKSEPTAEARSKTLAELAHHHPDFFLQI